MELDGIGREMLGELPVLAYFWQVHDCFIVLLAYLFRVNFP
jgi:hypothetical protein